MPKPSLQIGDLVYWKSKHYADKEDVGMVIEIIKEKNCSTRQVRIEWFKDDGNPTLEYYPDAKKMRQDLLKKYA
jgi:hypothetical protein